MHARNPRIAGVARLLGRTPSSVAMKLVNFASLDPAHRARGVKGLSGHSRGDEQIWNEFCEDWDKMTVLSETTLLRFQRAAPPAGELIAAAPDAPTEATATILVRTMQGFFRKAVLAAYHSRCCVTGLPVEDLLVASHILPWSGFPQHRLNPRNGLCLAAHFDRAFDRGLIAFDRGSRLMISPALKRYGLNPAIQAEFLRREGTPLICPDRFPPDAEFLTYHRNQIYKRSY